MGIGLTIKLVNIPDNRVMGVNGLADEVTEGTIMSESANEKRWYVIHAYSGYERKVKLALEERIDLSSSANFTLRS